MTKKQLIVSSAIFLLALGSYDLYKMKFADEVERVQIVEDETSTGDQSLTEGVSEDASSTEDEAETNVQNEIPVKSEEESIDSIIEELDMKDTGIENIEFQPNKREEALAEEAEEVLLEEFEKEFQEMEAANAPHAPSPLEGSLQNAPEAVEPIKPEVERSEEEEIAMVEKEAEEDRISFYENKVQVLNEESNKLKEKVISYEISSSELRKNLGILEQKNFALKGEISYLNAMLKGVKEKSAKEVSTLSENLRGYQEQLEKNNKEIASLSSKSEELKQSIREGEGKIILLNEQLGKKTSEIKEMQRRVDESLKTREKNQVEISTLKDNLAAVEARSKAIESDQAEAYKRLEEIKLSKAETENRIKEILVRNNEIEQILIKKESEIDGNHKQIGFLKDRVASILKEKREKVEKLTKVIEEKKGEISSIKKENKEKRGEIIDLLKKVDELTQILEGLKRNKDSLKKEITDGNKKRDELLGIIKLKEDGNKKIGEALSESKTKNRELSRRVEELKKDKLQLQFKHDKEIEELEKRLKGSEEKYSVDIINAKYDTIKVVDVKTVGSNSERYDREIAKVLGSSNESLLEDLAKNPKLNKDILRGLAKNQSFYIRNEVAKNPGITSEIMAILSRDEVSIVKMSLMDNPKVSKSVLEVLKSDGDKKVSEYAQYRLLRFK